MDSSLIYFNSGDSESLQLFPSNKVSNFTPLIPGEIYCVNNKFSSALHLIYIPPRMSNLSSLYLRFSIVVTFKKENKAKMSIDFLQKKYLILAIGKELEIFDCQITIVDKKIVFKMKSDLISNIN